MNAGRIHYFGPPNAIAIDEIPCPTPEEGELVVRVAAIGGRWFRRRHSVRVFVQRSSW